MHILYLCNNFPYPLTSGYLRHFYLIKELSQQHRITLFALVGPTFQENHAQAMAPFTHRILTLPVARGTPSWQKAWRWLVAGGLNPTARRIQHQVAELLQHTSIDVVLLSGKETQPALNILPNLPVVVDMCDATSMRIRRSIHYTKPAFRLALWVKYWRIRHIEQSLIRHADHLIFISSRDREDLLGHEHANTTIVPNGIDLTFWQRSTSQRGQNTVVFTGAMHYPPNTDAALYLIYHIWPHIHRSIPEAQLWIVGRDPTPALVQAGQTPGVTVTGWVDDIRPYLEQATVFAAPLRFGAGTQNKLLEAMAMEVPVVASPLAAEGLRTESGAHPPITVAQPGPIFTQRIMQKLIEGQSDPAPDIGARRFVAAHFDWQKSAGRLQEILYRVIQIHRPYPKEQLHA